MTVPYRVVLSNKQCKSCGQGSRWSVVGPDGMHGIEYEYCQDAHDICHKLNDAYEQGRTALKPRKQSHDV